LNPDGQPMRAADATFQPSFRYSHTWAMFGDRWTLFFHTTPLFDAQSTRSRAWWFLGCGLLCTALVCWALSVQVRGRWREATRAAELQEARDALQAAYRQRERLSHDLHDGAIQSLYAVQLGLSRAARELQELAPESGLRLSDSRASLDVVIGELRQFITQLENTGELHDATGLAAVLDAVVRRLRLASPVAIDLVCDDAISRRLTPTQAVQLASLAREALSNSLRHANARRVSLNLRAQGSACILEIQDDGRGFDLASPSGQGLGLRSIRQRATDLGGKLELESTPGVGTLVRIHVPLAAAPLAGPG
jgi:signal transduction histidine kinase